jgi:hypothetical protein
MPLENRGPFIVYIYRDPRPDRGREPIYVGKGTLRSGRHRQHLWRATNVRLRRKLDLIKAAGLDPIIEVVLQTEVESAAFEAERRIIAEFGRADRKEGPLCNATDGGEGATGARRSEAEKCRLRAAWPLVAAQVAAGRDQSWADPDRCSSRIRSLKAAHSRPEVREHFMASRPNRESHPERGKKIADSLRLTLAAPSAKESRSSENRRRWADEQFREMTSKAISAGRNRHWIILDDGRRFGSASEAALALGVTPDCVTLRCRKGTYTRVLKEN